MLQDRYETDKLFDSILTLTNQMDPVLAQIDQLLEDEALYQLIWNDLARRYPLTEQTGRNSTPVEVILRMLAVKRLYGLSYERTEYQVRDSLVLRQFCRVYFNEVPDDTTLIRWAGLIQPEDSGRFQSSFDATGDAAQSNQRTQAAHRWHGGRNQHSLSQ